MKSKMMFKFCVLLSAIILVGCAVSDKNKRQSSSPGNENQQIGMASPPVIVYKTRNDYYDKVPVILSDDKTRIVSFPDPRDLKIDGTFAYPSKLNGGYLLDNRGINQNAAFLKFSYEQYCNMDNIPTADRLFDYITDNNPFTEIYQCGSRGNYKEIVAELNALISSGKIKDCKNLLK